MSIDLPSAPVTAFQAALRAVPPPWNHALAERDLGTQLVEPAARRFDLSGAQAQALFDSLAQGFTVSVRFGPVGTAAQAVVNLSPVRFLLAAPAFEGCVADLGRSPPPRPVHTAPVQPTRLASLAAPPRAAPASRGVTPPVPAPEATVPVPQSDPYIRADSAPAPVARSAAAVEDAAEGPAATAQATGKDPGSGLRLVTELLLSYGPAQDELSEAGRIELGSFVREYRVRGSRDLVLIAGSSADGAQTRRRALEIKGYLVRNGLAAARVLIHVQGEKLPQRDGQPVAPPDDANRVAVWQVR